MMSRMFKGWFSGKKEEPSPASKQPTQSQSAVGGRPNYPMPTPNHVQASSPAPRPVNTMPPPGGMSMGGDMFSGMSFGMTATATTPKSGTTTAPPSAFSTPGHVGSSSLPPRQLSTGPGGSWATAPVTPLGGSGSGSGMAPSLGRVNSATPTSVQPTELPQPTPPETKMPESSAPTHVSEPHSVENQGGEEEDGPSSFAFMAEDEEETNEERVQDADTHQGASHQGMDEYGSSTGHVGEGSNESEEPPSALLPPDDDELESSPNASNETSDQHRLSSSSVPLGVNASSTTTDGTSSGFMDMFSGMSVESSPSPAAIPIMSTPSSSSNSSSSASSPSSSSSTMSSSLFDLMNVTSSTSPPSHTESTPGRSRAPSDYRQRAPSNTSLPSLRTRADSFNSSTTPSAVAAPLSPSKTASLTNTSGVMKTGNGMSRSDSLSVALETRVQAVMKASLNSTKEATAKREKTAALMSEMGRLNGQVEMCMQEEAKAIETEDFEKAEELNSQLETMRKRLLEIKAELGRGTGQGDGRSLGQARLESRELNTAVGQLMSEVTTETREIQEGVVETCHGQRVKLEKDSEVIALTQDRLDKQSKLIEGDLLRVDDEMKEVQAQEDLEAKDEQDRHHQLQVVQMTLEAEYEELQRQLEKKRQELEANDTQLKDSEEKLARIHQTYERKYKRVEDRKQAVLSDKAEVDKDVEDLQSRRAQHRSEEAQVLTRLRIAEIEKERTERLGTVAVEVEQRTEQLVSDLAKWQDELESVGAEVDAALNELKIVDVEVEAARTKARDLEQQEAMHQQVIADANLKIPTLNAEKKVAVTAKNFKQAGALSKEIQQIQQTQKESEEAVTRLVEEAKVVAVLVTDLEKRKTEAEQRVRESEEKRDRTMIRKNITIARELVKRALFVGKRREAHQTLVARAAGEVVALKRFAQYMVDLASGALNVIGQGFGNHDDVAKLVEGQSTVTNAVSSIDSIVLPVDRIKWFASDVSLDTVLEVEERTLGELAEQFANEANELNTRHGWDEDITIVIDEENEGQKETQETKNDGEVTITTGGQGEGHGEGEGQGGDGEGESSVSSALETSSGSDKGEDANNAEAIVDSSQSHLVGTSSNSSDDTDNTSSGTNNITASNDNEERNDDGVEDEEDVLAAFRDQLGDDGINDAVEHGNETNPANITEDTEAIAGTSDVAEDNTVTDGITSNVADDQEEKETALRLEREAKTQKLSGLEATFESQLKQLANLTQELETINAEIDATAEREEFEKAEELQAVADGITSRRDELNIANETLKSQIDTLRKYLDTPTSM